MTVLKFTAKSASDKTDDWPFWMVWDGARNVTSQVKKALGYDLYRHVFASREDCELLSEEANKEGLTL